MNDFTNSFVGGIIIGIAVTVMLIFNGRVTGISGIIYNTLIFPFKESFWRFAFLGGLVTGGVIMHGIEPRLIFSQTHIVTSVVAGFLVGFGSVLGSGCTSGHGVCGISRLSIRSIVATCVFIAAGILSVWVFKT